MKSRKTDLKRLIQGAKYKIWPWYRVVQKKKEGREKTRKREIREGPRTLTRQTRKREGEKLREVSSE